MCEEELHHAEADLLQTTLVTQTLLSSFPSRFQYHIMRGIVCPYAHPTVLLSSAILDYCS
jgi:hypothetical protein